jgi:hypothetical protein
MNADDMRLVSRLFSSVDDTSAPALPPKRDQRTIDLSSKVRSISCRTHSVDVSPVDMSGKQDNDNDNDEQIQSIVDDINHIIEDYTRELDDALSSATATIPSRVQSYEQADMMMSYANNQTSQSLSSMIMDETRRQTVQPSLSTSVPPLPPKRDRGN